MTTIPLPVHRTGYPDADLDVLIYLADGSSTLGAWLGEYWVDSLGMRVDDVRGWSPLPELEAA